MTRGGDKVDSTRHPCFNEKARFRWGRLHLPIAADCNIQCNFCNRKYHCLNEARPGVTSFLLDPESALSYVDSVLARRKDISVIGVAGPGDPFSHPDITLGVLKQIHLRYPQLCLCVSTNGLNVYRFIDDLRDAGVTHVTVTVNAIDPSIGQKIYSCVKVNDLTYKGLEAAKILIHNQRKSLRKLKENGFTVKVNSVVVPGINMGHILDIAKEMGLLNVDVMNCIPFIPVEGTLFSDIPAPKPWEILQIRDEAEKYVPQMRHCARCRADAVGFLYGRTSYLDYCSNGTMRRVNCDSNLSP